MVADAVEYRATATVEGDLVSNGVRSSGVRTAAVEHRATGPVEDVVEVDLRLCWQSEAKGDRKAIGKGCESLQILLSDNNPWKCTKFFPIRPDVQANF